MRSFATAACAVVVRALVFASALAAVHCTIAPASAAPAQAVSKRIVKPPYNVSWYTRPQRLVDVGGRRLNLLCTGSGSPTVLLESGLLADLSAWRLVQPAISRHTRVCSYDRAGMGFSDPAGAPRDAAAIVRDLHTLLVHAGVTPPYVLAGWSSGGLYTRLYQYRYPREVVGLVEVDPDSEFDADDATLVGTIMHKPPQWFRGKMRALQQRVADCASTVTIGTCSFFRGGLSAFLQRQRAKGCPATAPAACAVADAQSRHFANPGLWRDESLEFNAGDRGKAEVRAAERQYGALPLIVLTDSEAGDIDHDGPITVIAQRAMWRTKDRAEERIASLSSAGAHFIVDGSPHAIPLFRPSAVISAVDEVVDQARR